MKTTFLAKVIFETDKLVEDRPNVIGGEIFTIEKFCRMINDPDYPNLTIEAIQGKYTDDLEPVIIIRDK